MDLLGVPPPPAASSCISSPSRTRETSPDSFSHSSSNLDGFSALNRDTCPTTDSVLWTMPEFDTTSPKPGPPRGVTCLYPERTSNVIIPPRTDAAVSAPDTPGKTVLSASIARFMTRLAGASTTPAAARAAAAPATQHAEDEPSPAPGGISDLTCSVMPSFCPPPPPPPRPATFRASLTIWYSGLRTASTLKTSCSHDSSSRLPSSDTTRMFLDRAALTYTRLSIAQRMARAPCTTKCSPKSITFPGADAAAPAAPVAGLPSSQSAPPRSAPGRTPITATRYPRHFAVAIARFS